MSMLNRFCHATSSLFDSIRKCNKVFPTTVAVAVVTLIIVGIKRSPSQRLNSVLNPDKMTTAISKVYPGVVVKSVEVVKVFKCGDGLASTTDRIIVNVTYEHDHAISPKSTATSIRRSLPPRRMLAKVILLNRIMRMGACLPVMKFAGGLADFFASHYMRPLSDLIWSSIVCYQVYFPHAPDAMYQTECRVYSELYQDFKDAEVNTAQFYGVVIDEATSTYCVLMEDLSQRGNESGVIFPTALRSASLVEVRALLVTLAKLHGKFWDSPRFQADGDLSWYATHVKGGMDPVFSCIGYGLINDQVERNKFKSHLLKPLNATVKELWDAMRLAQCALASDTMTLCHGDTHVANTFIMREKINHKDDDDESSIQVTAGLFDFQLSIKGCFAHDVNYFIVTSMDPAERRKHEKDLLQFYLTELERNISKRNPSHQLAAVPSFEHAWLRYRQTALWGLVIGWLICPPVNYGEAICAANIERMSIACKDLDSLAAVHEEP